MVVRVFFVFQAEDGIRDLVRSRGLGDVYKRQAQDRTQAQIVLDALAGKNLASLGYLDQTLFADAAVSYTHLTLPTSDLV
mgnify:CR=1 FL=1